MADVLRVALVGCGRIARRHADILAGSHVKGARLAGVCDVIPDRVAEFARRYGVPGFGDMDRMMEEVRPDVAVVLTPSGMHAEHAIRLAAHGCHLVVEKPMALTLDDADAMIRACDAARVKLFIVKQNRFNLPIVKLREALEAGRFGRLALGTVRVRWCREQAYYDQDSWRGTWALDGGVIANQASHHVDLLEWMMGDVESVFAKSATALVRIETEDTMVATLKFRNGALGVIEATTAARPNDLEGSLSILGEKGTVEVGGFAVNEMRTWQFRDPVPSDADVRSKYSVNPPNVYGFGHQAYYEYVVRCLSGGGPHLVDGLVGRRSLELITAIYESSETGKEVFLRFSPKKCKLGLRSE
jgi:predicted dehydrogenase